MANAKEFYAKNGLDIGGAGQLLIEGDAPSANQFLAITGASKAAFKTLVAGENINITHSDSASVINVTSNLVGSQTIYGNLTVGRLGGTWGTGGNASATSTTITVTWTAHGFSTGQSIPLAFFKGSGINTPASQAYPITVVDANSFSISLTGPFAASSGGKVIVGGVTTIHRSLTVGLDPVTNEEFTSNPALTVRQKWNGGTAGFKAVQINITDTASAAGSMALEINGGPSATTSLFSVDKNGKTLVANALTLDATTLTTTTNTSLTVGAVTADIPTYLRSGVSATAITLAGTTATFSKVGVGMSKATLEATPYNAAFNVAGSISLGANGTGVGWDITATSTKTYDGTSGTLPNNGMFFASGRNVSIIGVNGISLLVGAAEVVRVETGAVNITGTLVATSKSFEIPHPSIENAKLRYGCLEGPENGVYIRGKSHGIIMLPDYWKDLVHIDSITVNTTPVGYPQQLYVETINDSMVVVRNASQESPNFFFTVYAERKDIDKLVVEIFE